MILRKFILVSVLALFFTTSAQTQVLGSCGSGAEGKMPPPPPKEQAGSQAVQPVPLPGQQAIDFELPAVVGNEIKNIKLSDYKGKWRVLCFFPAAFTFV